MACFPCVSCDNGDMDVTEKLVVLGELRRREAGWKTDRHRVALWTAALLQKTNLTAEEIGHALEITPRQVYRRVAEAQAFMATRSSAAADAHAEQVAAELREHDEATQ